MRFTVSSSALSSKLNMLAKVIGSKNSLPILDCFLFQVANGEMSITASDSDNVIKIHSLLPTTMEKVSFVCLTALSSMR